MTGSSETPEPDLPQVAVLFTQFAPYHVDRIEALARRLAGRARVLGVECASASHTYRWEPVSGFSAAEHVTLFPGAVYDEIGSFARLRAYAGALREASLVLVGVPYSEPDIIALAWRLRAKSTRVAVMTDSKFDDKPRNLLREQVKGRLLGAFSAGMVAGLRQRDYLRFLGFGERLLVPGYDTLSVARVRGLAGEAKIAWADRPFTYVGRLVGKKNLPVMLDAYARYVALASDGARRLVLVGDGELDRELRALASALGIAERVEFAGHCDAREVARRLAEALALVLVSTEEQWGLVVNEAVALGIPAIVSSPVGARDALVRGGVTGHVVEPGSPESIARAMFDMGSSEEGWRAMGSAAAARDWLADAERFADAGELLFDPGSAAAAEAVERMWRAMEAG